MKKKHKLYSAALILVLIVTGAAYFYPSSSNLSEPVISDYSDPPNLSVIDPENFAQLAEASDLIIYGKIERNLEKYYVESSDDNLKKLDEKKKSLGIRPHSGPGVIPTTLTVDRVLKGDYANKEITIIQSELYEDYSVKLQENNKYVIFLEKGADGSYIPMHPYAAFIDANDEKKLKPFFKKNDFSDIENISLNKLQEVLSKK